MLPRLWRKRWLLPRRLSRRRPLLRRPKEPAWPVARREHGAVARPTTGTVLIHGGAVSWAHQQQFVNDVWEYTPPDGAAQPHTNATGAPATVATTTNSASMKILVNGTPKTRINMRMTFHGSPLDFYSPQSRDWSRDWG